MGLMVYTTYSQELVPPIQNFSPSEYSAASQNWDIAVDDRGVVYTANNQGLLVFDGINWELFPLESQSIIRSVYPHKDRIYTGSYEEFGFWKRDSIGKMKYTSLSPLMEDFNMQSDEFWEILAYKDTIYFRSFGAVYKYDGAEITKVEDLVSTALGTFKGKMVYAPRMQGLAYLDENGNSKPLDGDLDVLEGVNIIDIEAQGDSLFIAGKESLYVYFDGKVRKINDVRLNELLSRSELNHIIPISSNEIILGTIKDGIVHYDFRDKSFQTYNRTAGLQNNTILGIDYFDEKLWLALDKGVDMIELKAPVNFYTDNSGELGAVYDLHNYNGNYYLASNTGIYNFTNSELRLIENAKDHTWNLEEINGRLYANHNTGIYEISNGKFVPIDTRTGSFSIDEIDGLSDKLLISHYTGISLYDQKTGEISELEGINFPVKQVVFENDNTFWAAHPYEGIYKISHENFTNLKVEKIRSLGQKENYNPKIYKLNNQVVAYVNGSWYQYNPFQDDFESFDDLKEYDGSKLIYKGSNYYVFIETDSGNLIITDLHDEKIRIAPEDLDQRMVKSNENFIRENDSIFYVTLNDGFARINLNKLRDINGDRWMSTPFLKEFADEKENYSLTGTPVIPYNSSKNIKVKVGLPVSSTSRLTYTLEGEETITGSINSGVLTFRNLVHGDYSLKLSAWGNGIDEVSTASYNFTIAPPWYLSLPMKLVYVLIFLSVIFLIYWLNKQKLKKHQLQLEAKFEKEHAERLNKIEKDRLMHEIDLKRKELANTTMMAAKKNEVLMEIQGELNKDKNKFSNQFRVKHIMTKINNAVKNKDEWKVFETNFNEVHEDFFKDVLEKYPKLTSKDLKLCSYLKMNLSSKEIAPLMGISVRGVEVHRYRLRKKMELDSDVNLTKFLIKNF
ncbi:regulatory LuxR family protein [Christiangramia gaetbulicola]|uniref:Regulatory LuxR family protein n=2 Tax=Christiangramia gaetbulicola TaxID=703340 RepID=A0A2T6AK99_9FLAO|nr:regulatory LuxR family protein [Christiangramia gaetbulicola]